MQSERELENPQKVFERKELKKELDNILDTLPQGEQIVLRHYYGYGEEKLNYREIGEKYNLTKERIRQIRLRAINRLRDSGRNELLRLFVD